MSLAREAVSLGCMNERNEELLRIIMNGKEESEYINSQEK